MKIDKYLFIGILTFCLNLSANAQIAKWVVRPDYDSIEMMDSGLLKVSLNGKVGLLNKAGEKVLPLEFDSITSFHEGRALLFNDKKFYGFTDMQGKVVELRNQNYELFPDDNRFHNEMLLVKQNNQYFYLNAQGEKAFGPYADAYPFFDNHACVKRYVDYIKKPEETFNDYIHTSGTEFSLPKLDKEDINFMSSFHNGSAVIVIKKKFYTINTNHELRPISIDSTARKESLVVAEKKEINIIRGEDGYMVRAKNGIFGFDNFMRPIYQELMGKERQIFEYAPEEKRVYTSRFTPQEKNQKHGLLLDGKEFLPPQFDGISHLEDEFAIVAIGGKCGVITVDENNQFLFKLNNNENIGFNHRYFDAKLTALMPPYIKCASATIKSLTEGCEIQVESRTENENVERNTLGYNCRLSIPKDLTDTLTTHNYYYSLNYDGLTSIPYKVSISEWYVKYYEVNLSNTNFTLSSINDTISVEFDLIKTDVARNDESNYFKNIEVVAYNMTEQPILNKITENHYALLLFGIEQERVNFSVKITEIGCPTIEYPFEMIFKKPEPKQKNKKTTVTITPIQKKSTSHENEIILVDD